MSKHLAGLLERGEVVFSFGELVRKAREDSGLKQSELAAIMHVSRAAIAAWENSTNRPNHWTIVRLAEVTEKPIGYFPDEHGEPMSRCTRASPEPTVIVDISRFRRRHSPSTKP